MPGSNTIKTGEIQTIDLMFRNVPGTIATYCIPHTDGVVLVECGPGSTVKALQAGIKGMGFEVTDITDVLLTHIHLDHAGAAGWLANQGARIHVHEIGKAHLIAPDKLLYSAKRIYGDEMEILWGKFLAVPEALISTVYDGDEIEINGLHFRALETLGHASHHLVYLCNDVCFTGDIGGVRLPGPQHLRLPMPPPEFHLELWRESLDRLKTEHKQGAFNRIAPTHFGIYNDIAWHFNEIQRGLDEVDAWMKKHLPTDPPFEQLNEQFLIWTDKRAVRDGLNKEHLHAYETANPSWMSTAGIQRYWNKFVNPT